MKSDYEIFRDMPFDQLHQFISVKHWAGKITPASQCVMTAKWIMGHCPERTLDICRIMANKEITPTQTAWFMAARQAYSMLRGDNHA